MLHSNVSTHDQMAQSNVIPPIPLKSKRIICTDGSFKCESVKDLGNQKIINRSKVWNEVKNTTEVSNPAIQGIRGDNWGYKKTTKCYIKAKAVWVSVTIGLACFYYASKKIL